MTWEFPEYPPDWDYIRQEALDRDNHKCKRCGSNYSLHVHHIISLSHSGSNDLSNLITLCEDCHAQCHPHMKGYQGEQLKPQDLMKYKVRDNVPHLYLDYVHLFDQIENEAISNRTRLENNYNINLNEINNEHSNEVRSLLKEKRYKKINKIIYRIISVFSKKYGMTELKNIQSTMRRIDEQIKKKRNDLTKVLKIEKERCENELHSNEIKRMNDRIEVEKAFKKKLTKLDSTYLCRRCRNEMEFSRYKVLGYRIVICPKCDNEEVV